MRNAFAKQSKRTKILMAFMLLLALCVCILIFAASYNGTLVAQKYTLTSNKASAPISFVLLSDLHDSSFGKDNQRLVEKVKKCEPDVIFTVGDMVSEYTEDFSYLSALYENLAEIAPVYCSLGNHETSHPESEKIKDILSEHATLLDNEYIEINLNGNEIRLGALNNYHPSLEHLNEYIRKFADTDKFTLLMSHCPEYYFWGVNQVKIDLMVSGHTHGGQVIIPFKGGLYAPEQGWWPYYDYGVFYEENATIVITRGLGTSKQALPRVNNPPEVLCVTIEPEVQNG